MKELSLNLAVRGQIAKSKVTDLAASLFSEQRGEMGSWMILAAGLAAAAATAVGFLATWFAKKTTDITSK